MADEAQAAKEDAAAADAAAAKEQADAQQSEAKEPVFDLAYVKQLRGENAAHRKKAVEAEAKLKAREEQDLSETEKQAKRLKELEAENVRLQAESRTATITALAAEAGAIKPRQVARLIDAEAADPEKEIAALKKSDAHLFTRPGAGSADGGAGGGKAGGDMNAFIRRGAGRS